MRRNSWLQNFLYLVMAVLGAYLLFKGGGLLAAKNQIQRALDGESVQQSLEDSAMRTWSLAYTAAIEGKKSQSWLSQWMQQIAPVFSYVADGEGTEEESESETSTQTLRDGQAMAESHTDGEETAGMSEDESGTEQQTEADSSTEQQTETESGTEQQTEIDSDAAQSAEVRACFAEALPRLSDFSWLLSNYYTVDADTSVDETLLNAKELLSLDLSIEKDPDVPQILIYHTHSQEAFSDSARGEVSDTIVGMGETLADELRGYGYYVIHDTGVYDLVDGVLDRSAAYDYARDAVEAILEEYPTIEVVIDLHRDGVEGSREDFVTEINGEATSKIMFFNGLSRDENGKEISWLPNSNLTENLAFSLQLQVLANAKYPGFTRKIYLQAERYNLHLRARSLLIEAGTQLNTVEEERNAMAPIADLIRQLLEES